MFKNCTNKRAGLADRSIWQATFTGANKTDCNVSASWRATVNYALLYLDEIDNCLAICKITLGETPPID